MIIAWNRQLMSYLQTNKFGIYADKNIIQETQNLPSESMQEAKVKSDVKKIQDIEKKVNVEPKPIPTIEPQIEPPTEPIIEPTIEAKIEPIVEESARERFERERQSIDEFFTPYWVAEIMYELAVRHGFKGGKVCEPSFGQGVFFDVLIANGIKEEDLYGFEIYKPNFDFVKAKYPKANLIDHNFEYEFAKPNRELIRDKIKINEDFQKTKFDMFIGNPPYGAHKSPYAHLYDKDAQVRTEGFFILLALSQLKKDGLCVFIINSLWMHNSQNYNKQKQLIANYGELIDSYRLPNGVFKGENRDTNIATDIVVFRRK
jgi:type I restriction-modification system DNA methylase subunit